MTCPLAEAWHKLTLWIFIAGIQSLAFTVPAVYNRFLISRKILGG